MNKTYTFNVVKDPDSDDFMLQLTEDFLNEQDWQIYDTIEFCLEDNSVIMNNVSKKERERNKKYE